MPRTVLIPGVPSLLALLACCGGCCECWHRLPDDCADLVYQCELACALHNVCSSTPLACSASHTPCGCGLTVVEDGGLLQEPPSCCPVPESTCGACVAPGPPPETFQPPMPPKFLPVPTHSVFSAAGVHVLTRTGSPVEVDFGPQLSFPARP